MKLQICILVMTLVIAGCSSSTLVTSTDKPGSLSIDAFNQKVHNEDVTIAFHDGSKTDGEGFRIANDSASWREGESGIRVYVPVAKVNTVSTGPNRLVGGLIGFGTGLAGGAFIGWRVAEGSTDHGEDRGLGILAGVVVGAGGGLIVGTIVGIAAPQPNVYELKTSSSDK